METTPQSERIDWWKTGGNLLAYGLLTLSCGVASWPVAIVATCISLAVVTYTLVDYARRKTWLFPGPLWPALALPVILLFCSGPRIGRSDSRNPALATYRNIAYGFQGSNETFKKVPANLPWDRDQPPLLSWRVHLLPFLEEAPLYQKFKLNEPWDSAANHPLSQKVPNGIQGYTNYPVSNPGDCFVQGFVGPGTAFEPGGPWNYRKDFPDGLSGTLLFTHAVEGVTWSKPADMTYHPDFPLPAIGRSYWRTRYGPLISGWQEELPGFVAAMADGSVRFVHQPVNEGVVRAAIVRNDGWVPEWE